MCVSLPGVTSAASVSVDVLAGRAVEVVAGAFALTHDLPFALPPDESASRCRWSKKKNTLTLAFGRERRRAPVELRIPGLDLEPGLLYVSKDPEGKKGRMLRAARDIEAGETVLVCEPVAAAVHDNAAGDACADCFAAAARFRCPRCPTRYCDARCAANDVAHEGECALVARLGDASKIRGARMFLRLLYLRSTRPSLFEKTYVWSASELRRDGGGVARDDASVLGSAAFLRSALPPSALPDDPERFVRAARENLHGVVRADGTLIGSAAYAAGSLANHACDPNCFASFLTGSDAAPRAFRGAAAADSDDSESATRTEFGPECRKKRPLLVMRATRFVKRHEEVTLGYVELYASRGERRARLLRSKGFLCACARCRDPPEADRALTGWLCARGGDGCAGVAAHDAFEADSRESQGEGDDRKNESLLRCGACGAETTARATRAWAAAAESRWRGVVARARRGSGRGPRRFLRTCARGASGDAAVPARRPRRAARAPAGARGGGGKDGAVDRRRRRVRGDDASHGSRRRREPPGVDGPARGVGSGDDEGGDRVTNRRIVESTDSDRAVCRVLVCSLRVSYHTTYRVAIAS